MPKAAREFADMPPTGPDEHDPRWEHDSRWPVWAGILFMLAVSLALWTLIVLAVLRLIEPD